MNMANTDIQQYLQSIDRELDIEFLLEDSQTDPDVALEKIVSLRSKGCQVVIGPYSSAEVEAVRDYCNQNDIVSISTSSVAISLAIEGDNIYRMVPDDRNQAEATVALLKDDLKKNLIAVTRDDLWGNELVGATYQQFVSEGGSLNTVISYSSNTTDFSTVIELVSNALSASLSTHSAEESGIYMVTFREGTDILRLASQNYILQQVDWYGASAYAQNGTLPLDWTASAFAADHHLACPIFGYDETTKDKWQPVADRIKLIIGRNPEIYALAVYDALWLTVLTYLSLDDYSNLEKFKAAFEFQCNNYTGTTGRTALNAAGDRSMANYDFWSIRLFPNEFLWYTSASYNNLTGELRRY
jgi:branched-chain amino acid transport system substrate-binding protein